MVILYKKRGKICEKCEEKNACAGEHQGAIINAGERFTGNPTEQRTNSPVLTGRKEKMKEEVLFGKYRVLKLLANGSGGEVFLTEHIVLGEQRVMKRLLKNRPFYAERRQEAHTLQQLQHVAIPRIFDIEEDDTACYIIEEYMGGETLYDFLTRQKCLPTSFISQYSIQLCEIIEYLHQNGILYLDVKPENILIREDKLSLIDFGGAIRKKECGGVVFGTPGYAAPEQYDGLAEERSDVYGIGCVLGVMLGEENKGRKELVKIQEKCVQNLPGRRYESVAAVKQALEKVAFGTQKKRKTKYEASFRSIGIVGVHEGAESGALCMMLATNLNEREKGRIACIDLSGQYIFGRLYENLFGKQKPIPEQFFLQGVCYVTEGNISTVGRYAQKEYKTILLHIGTRLDQYRDEFFRCDKRFALGNAFPWRLGEWEALSERLDGLNLRQGLTAVVSGGEKQLLPKRFCKVIELSFAGDVLLPDRKTEKVICRSR